MRRSRALQRARDQGTVFEDQGGRTRFHLALLEMVKRRDEDATKVLTVWNRLSRVRRAFILFDVLLLEAQIDDLIGFVERLGATLALMETAFVNALASNRYRAMAAASFDRAMEPGGVADRKLLFEHHGFLPKGKAGLSRPDPTVPEPDVIEDPGLPTFERETLNLRPFVRRHTAKTGT